MPLPPVSAVAARSGRRPAAVLAVMSLAFPPPRTATRALRPGTSKRLPEPGSQRLDRVRPHGGRGGVTRLVRRPTCRGVGAAAAFGRARISRGRSVSPDGYAVGGELGFDL